MNLGNERESTHFVDRTAVPWYDPHKIMANVLIEVNRLVGDKKQAELDAKSKVLRDNPIAPPTPEQINANYNAQVRRDPNGRGWIIKTPGAVFDESAPDYGDSTEIQKVLKQAGLAK